MTVCCPRCGGGFVCVTCEYPLRKVHEDGVNHVISSAHGVLPDAIGAFIRSIEQKLPYTTRFESGPCGGAVLDFGDGIRVECFLPFVNSRTGDVLPFLPMEPRLTRPMLRAMLGVTDAFLNEHGRDLPGVLPTWALTVSTIPFMSECFFNPEFRFPTREASRSARREARRRQRWMRRPRVASVRRHKVPRAPRGRKNSTPEARLRRVGQLIRFKTSVTMRRRPR